MGNDRKINPKNDYRAICHEAGGMTIASDEELISLFDCACQSLESITRSADLLLLDKIEAQMSLRFPKPVEYAGGYVE
ncbi:MAG TPA: hypothetical protein ENK04_05795 [Gammaproteobacteria bacterium]|nr:hypothetical protein [Gammaproteobacteria bacterium]